MFIVIIGPDGSGKTTIANEVVKYFKKNNIIVHHMGMNFGILPQFRNIFKFLFRKKTVPSHKEGEYLGGMKNPPVPFWKGMILVAWYGFDYFLGNFKLIKWQKKGEHVVFARYFYDYYFQRGYINTPKWFIKIIEFIIPKPDYIFTIKRDPNDIFTLKPELTLDEIKRQQDIIDDLLKNRHNAYIINGNNGIKNTLKQIIEIIGENS